MITLIAAAIAAAAPAPAAPMQMPADAHAQHQQAPQGHEQHGQMAAMGDDCCWRLGGAVNVEPPARLAN